MKSWCLKIKNSQGDLASPCSNAANGGHKPSNNAEWSVKGGKANGQENV